MSALSNTPAQAPLTAAAHRSVATCPAGHPVEGSRTLRCPTCGRLLLHRYERICPNGHVVSSPSGVCPYCGEAPAPDRTPYYLALGAVIAFALLVVLGLAANVPERLIAWTVDTWHTALGMVTSIPLFQ